MKQVRIRSFVIILGLLLIAPQVFAEMSKTELQTMYVDFLKGEGYKPTVDADGDVIFKAEGKNFYIDVTEDDLNFFRLVFPGFWEIESESERAKVGIAAAHANNKTKVAKAYIIGDTTSIAIEIFVNEPDDFKESFPRMLNAISTSLNHFKTKMNELQ